MEKRFKGLVAINDVLDDRYQKLSDKYHDLELSHNRKKKLLRALRNYFTVWSTGHIPNEFGGSVCVRQGVLMDYDSCQRICRDIDEVLFCDGRINTCLKRKKGSKRTLKNAKKLKKENNG